MQIIKFFMFLLMLNMATFMISGCNTINYPSRGEIYYKNDNLEPVNMRKQSEVA
jgi:hypothetical protein